MTDDFDLPLNRYSRYLNKIETIYLGHTRPFVRHGFQSYLPKQTKIAGSNRTLCTEENP